jgi:hypothetical protein
MMGDTTSFMLQHACYRKYQHFVPSMNVFHAMTCFVVFGNLNIAVPLVFDSRLANLPPMMMPLLYYRS